MSLDMHMMNKLYEKFKKGVIHLEDRLIESLGQYFVYHKIRERYGLSFEQFIEKWERGVWKA